MEEIKTYFTDFFELFISPFFFKYVSTLESKLLTLFIVSIPFSHIFFVHYLRALCVFNLSLFPCAFDILLCTIGR